MSTVLIIEGKQEKTAFSLSQGFRKLLGKIVSGSMPTIIMGDSKEETIKKYKKRPEDKKHALVDLDKPDSDGNKQKDLLKWNLDKSDEKIYFMIQEMEAWFISQPDVLKQTYGKAIEKHIPKKHAKDISKPSDELKRWTKQINKKNSYHKVQHAVKLLQLLDAKQLCDDFEDFKHLVDELSKN